MPKSAAAADFDYPPPQVDGLRIVLPGSAEHGCANNDGPAVELVFFVADGPAAGPDQVAPIVQKLHLRVNAPIERVAAKQNWIIGDPDIRDGMLAWVCADGARDCDFASAGKVTFTRIGDQNMSGKWSLTLQSRRTIGGEFSAILFERPPQNLLHPRALCG